MRKYNVESADRVKTNNRNVPYPLIAILINNVHKQHEAEKHCHNQTIEGSSTNAKF